MFGRKARLPGEVAWERDLIPSNPKLKKDDETRLTWHLTARSASEAATPLSLTSLASLPFSATDTSPANFLSRCASSAAFQSSIRHRLMSLLVIHSFKHPDRIE